jgi:crotonobetainyl-CoA:carnitine CoA-transferase CaiB-like acyl-CoA transferase
MDGTPQGLTFGLGDIVAANAAVVAVLDRLLRGGGGHVDLSQLEAMSAHLGTGTLETALPTAPPTDRTGPMVLPSPGHDRWLAVGQVPRVDLTAVAAGAEPVRWLEEYVATTDAEEAAAHLQQHGIPAYPVRDGRDLVELDPQLAARDFYPVLAHPLAGQVRVEGPVHHLTDTPPRLRRPAPLLGEHTDELLSELLGLGPDDIARLREQGVLS